MHRSRRSLHHYGRDRPKLSPRSTPPLTSSTARPPTCATAARTSSGVMLSSSSRGALASSASSISAASRTSTASGSSGRAARARRTASPTPPASAEWFSLIRMQSKSPIRWLTPPPCGDRGLLEHPQPRRRLARVEDLRPALADAAHDARGLGRHAREAAEEVQRRALGGEQRARRALDAQHRAALAPLALRPEPRRPRRRDRAAGTPPRRPPSPEITPGAFCVIVARAARRGATVASVVASPSPTSSASARSMRSVSIDGPF